MKSILLIPKFEICYKERMVECKNSLLYRLNVKITIFIPIIN